MRGTSLFANLTAIALALSPALAVAQLDGSHERYTRATAVVAVEACIRNHSDPRCNEDAAAYLTEVYDHGDKTLLPLLVRAGAHSDGALSEILGTFYSDVLTKSPRPLLVAIARLSSKEQKSVIFLAATGDGSGIPEEDLSTVSRKLSVLVRDKSVVVRHIAARLLAEVQAQNSKRPN